MRSFLQKNEINVCMVELLKKYGAYIRAKAIRADPMRLKEKS